MEMHHGFDSTYTRTLGLQVETEQLRNEVARLERENEKWKLLTDCLLELSDSLLDQIEEATGNRPVNIDLLKRGGIRA